jgi:hypothetical protein
MAKVCSHSECSSPVFSKGLCKYHWGPAHGKQLARTTPLPKATKPINKKSKKRAADDRIYYPKAKRYIETNTTCMLRLPGCSIRSTEVHHLYSGSTRDKYYLVEEEWLASCPNCHHVVHDVMSQEEAIKKGFKKVE